MSPVFGYAQRWLIASVLLGAPAAAQTLVSTPVAATEPAPAQSVASVAPQGWQLNGTVRALTGYTDNVLWSGVEAKGRGFGQAEVEAILWRPERAWWEAKALLSGEVRRYLDALPEAAGEQRWVGRGELAATPRSWVRVSLVPQVFYMDQVYDLSPDLARRFVAKLRVRGASGNVQARVALPGGWEIEPAVQERTVDYFDFTEDFSETKTGVRLRWRSGVRVEAGAAIFDHRREYRDRVNYTAGGRALPGTKLRFDQMSAEANLTWSWNARGAWSVSPAVVYLENRDGAFGFFDYDQRRARVDVAWEVRRWRVDFEASAGRYDYRVQTVGMGLAPPARLREDFTAGVAVEYAWRERWKIAGRYEWERSRTNESNASYRLNTVSSGVTWSF